MIREDNVAGGDKGTGNYGACRLTVEVCNL